MTEKNTTPLIRSFVFFLVHEIVLIKSHFEWNWTMGGCFQWFWKGFRLISCHFLWENEREKMQKMCYGQTDRQTLLQAQILKHIWLLVANSYTLKLRHKHGRTIEFCSGEYKSENSLTKLVRCQQIEKNGTFREKFSFSLNSSDFFSFCPWQK